MKKPCVDGRQARSTVVIPTRRVEEAIDKQLCNKAIELLRSGCHELFKRLCQKFRDSKEGIFVYLRGLKFTDDISALDLVLQSKFDEAKNLVYRDLGRKPQVS